MSKIKSNLPDSGLDIDKILMRMKLRLVMMLNVHSLVNQFSFLTMYNFWNTITFNMIYHVGMLQLTISQYLLLFITDNFM